LTIFNTGKKRLIINICNLFFHRQKAVIFAPMILHDIFLSFVIQYRQGKNKGENLYEPQNMRQADPQRGDAGR
jgi:hypothetical protein